MVSPITIYQERKNYFKPEDYTQVYELITETVQNRNLAQNPETAFTILIELIRNAEKANAKKILLQEADPERTARYLWLDETCSTPLYRFHLDANIHEVLKNSAKWIKLSIILEENNLVFSVENNFPLLMNEKCRIQEVLRLVDQDLDFLKLHSVLNPTGELAGVGLAMSFLLLKSEGIGPENIRLEQKGDVTFFAFVYPPPTQKKSLDWKLVG